MNLFIFINCVDNKIIKLQPSDEEFSARCGDVVGIDEDKYLVLEISTEEFSEYELVVTKIILSEFKEGEDELY